MNTTTTTTYENEMEDVNLEEEELKAQAMGRKHSDYYYLQMALNSK